MVSIWHRSGSIAQYLSIYGLRRWSRVSTMWNSDHVRQQIQCIPAKSFQLLIFCLGCSVIK
jgi:hypothetical protein